MDYQSIHGPGVSNFSSPSPHRMPTLSAAEALQNLESSSTRWISTGLQNLDHALQNKDTPSISTNEEQNNGGITRGKVTEFYGPPGVGKTAFGMHLMARVLQTGENAVWVDGSHPIPSSRFAQILNTSLTPDIADYYELLKNFHHFMTPTLAHLLGLLTFSDASFPPENTSLIIIDSFSTLIESAFPRNVDAISTPRKPGTNPPSRKFPILQSLLSSLQKLAETRNIAIVIFTQCITKMRSGLGAALVPAISGPAWEQGLWCRVALFRDWGWDDDAGEKVVGVRFAQIIKAEGKVLHLGSGGRFAGFVISDTGISAVYPPTPPTYETITQTPTPVLPLPPPPIASLPQKRKRTEIEEIPDSDAEDDEDYGWAEEDEQHMPVMPPQWQGSEDILVVPPMGDAEGIEEEGEGEVDGDDDVGTERKDGRSSGYGEGGVPDSEDELAL